MDFINEEVERFAHDHTEPESDLFRRLQEETYASMQHAQMQVGRIRYNHRQSFVRARQPRGIRP